MWYANPGPVSGLVSLNQLERQSPSRVPARHSGLMTAVDSPTVAGAASDLSCGRTDFPFHPLLLWSGHPAVCDEDPMANTAPIQGSHPAAGSIMPSHLVDSRHHALLKSGVSPPPGSHPCAQAPQVSKASPSFCVPWPPCVWSPGPTRRVARDNARCEWFPSTCAPINCSCVWPTPPASPRSRIWPSIRSTPATT